MAGPTISATVVTLVRQGLIGLGALHVSLIRWRFSIRWYVLVLIGVPVAGWLAGRSAFSPPPLDLSTPALLMGMLVNVLISGPPAEELGWRGFALPRLLRRYSPFTASLVLGAVWGVWHQPSFFLSGMTQSALSLPVFLFGTSPLSILATWVFRHTGGSVLITVLLHYMVNFSHSVPAAPLVQFTLAMAAAAVLVLVLDKESSWFSSPALSENRPAGHPQPALTA